MRILLVGGPKDQEVLDIPEGLLIFRVPVPIERTITEITNSNPWDIDTDIADYRFTRRAIVNLKGEVKAVIYEFAGME